MIARYLTAIALATGLSATLYADGVPRPPEENEVKFDTPRPGGQNHDRPKAGTITAKGSYKAKTGWNCSRINVTVQDTDFTVKYNVTTPVQNNKWFHLITGFDSGSTYVVIVTAVFQDGGGNLDAKTAVLTVKVK